MDPKALHDILLPASLALFDPKLSSPNARAMILAIGMQESDLVHRQQLVGGHRNWWESVKGPAVSFWGFERIGIREVLRHPASRPMALQLLRTLGYPEDIEVIREAMKHNDLLAASFARLALWRLPQPLPGPSHLAESWAQYLQIWAPGKPKRERWNERYWRAWEIVSGAELRAAA